MYRNLNMDSLPNEEWRPVKNYDTMYLVSNLGRIKSISTEITDKRGRTYKKQPIIRRQAFTSTGYLMINFKRKYFKVHRLVAEAFIPKIKGKNIVNHKDCNPINNKASNLEWVTQKENVQHAINNNRMPNYTQLSQESEKEIISLYMNKHTLLEVAKHMGVKPNIVKRVLRKSKIKKISRVNFKSKYTIDRNKIYELLDNGERNINIAKLYNCPANLIAKIKQQYKKEKNNE